MSMSTRSKTARLAARQAAAAAAPPPPASPEVAPDGTPHADKCAICLSNVVNKCKTNSCRHEFCFGCLLEWSKVKAECPLCKTAMSTIYHNIRVIDGREVHDTYNIPINNDDFNGLFGGPQTLSQLGIRLSAGIAQANADFDRFQPFSLPGDIENYLHSIVHLSPPPIRNLSARAGPPPAHASSSRSQVNPFLRFLEFGASVLPEGLSINAVLPLPFSGPPDNPFVGPEDDFAGAELFPHEDWHSTNGTQSYQRRRRIYDRGQYVSPFDSSLQPGVVFFPSVEYFRTHPTSFTRIKPWLKRELTVLLGLTTPRSRLAALYELIVSMLLRHDIRGREFREMIRVYFESTSRVKHFQHEFYHFVLSGMTLEMYDSVASYAENRRDARTENRAVPVVTIEDDEERPPALRQHDAAPSRTYERRRRRHLAHSPSMVLGEGSRRRNDEVRERSRHRLITSITRERSRSREEGRRNQEPKNEAAAADSDSDDCQLLGVHPIVKPPPLAIITIDSDVSDNEANQFGYYQERCEPEPSSAGPSKRNKTSHLDVVTDSPSSSSVHVVDEIYNSARDVSRGRPSSPKPSTSAAARACFSGYNRPPMKKSDYLLQRMLEDMNTLDQESEQGEPTQECEDNGQSQNHRGQKRRKISSSASTVSSHHNSVSEDEDGGSFLRHPYHVEENRNDDDRADSRAEWRYLLKSCMKVEGLAETNTAENSSDWEYTSFAADESRNEQVKDQEDEILSSSMSSFSTDPELAAVEAIREELTAGTITDDLDLLAENNADSDVDDTARRCGFDPGTFP